MLTQEIPDMLSNARGLLVNLARMLNAEFDDVYQEAAVLALEIAPKLATVNNPRPYFLRAVRFHILSLYTLKPNHQVPLSLDMPMFDDGEATLADMLPAAPLAPGDGARDESLDERDQVLYAALHQLPLEEQSYLRESFKLNAFEPAPASWPCPAPRYDRIKWNMRKSAFNRLRKNAMLVQLVEVQSC